MERKEALRLQSVLPSERQLRQQEMEFYGFIHFSINTFTGREWGDGTEDPALFAPKNLDCRQWASMLKTLRRRRQNRLGQGKKVTATDERYFRRTEEYLYSELAMALGKKKSEMEEFISLCIRKREQA